MNILNKFFKLFDSVTDFAIESKPIHLNKKNFSNPPIDLESDSDISEYTSVNVIIKATEAIVDNLGEDSRNKLQSVLPAIKGVSEFRKGFYEEFDDDDDCDDDDYD